MPIYEYRCGDCEHCFEALVLAARLETLECPSCQSHNLEQLISAFLVNSATTAKASFSKAKKNAEKSIREQKIGMMEDMKDHH
jgi:putative FmdB family regulatory protein